MRKKKREERAQKPRAQFGRRFVTLWRRLPGHLAFCKRRKLANKQLQQLDLTHAAVYLNHAGSFTAGSIRRLPPGNDSTELKAAYRQEEEEEKRRNAADKIKIGVRSNY